MSHPAQTRLPIRFYSTSLSGHGHRVHLFLSLLDLPFEIIEVDMAAGANRSAAFLALNPFGQIPVIDDNGTVLSDSNAILVYLAKRYGGGAWLPDDAHGAASVQRWLSLAAGQIAYGPCAARLVTLFGAALNLETAQAIALRLFTVLEAEFAASGQPFAAGADATIADVAAYAYIAHAPEGGITLQPYPHLRAWLRRVEVLPRFVAMPSSRIGLLALSH